MNTAFIQRQAAKLPRDWKLATVRCCIYAAIVGWGSFQTGVEGYESFHDMTQMQFWKFLGNIGVSMLGVWLAFLDQTMSRINNGPVEPPASPQASIPNP